MASNNNFPIAPSSPNQMQLCTHAGLTPVEGRGLPLELILATTTRTPLSTTRKLDNEAGSWQSSFSLECVADVLMEALKLVGSNDDRICPSTRDNTEQGTGGTNGVVSFEGMELLRFDNRRSESIFQPSSNINYSDDYSIETVDSIVVHRHRLESMNGGNKMRRTRDDFEKQ